MAVTRERVAEQLKALRQLHGTADKPLSREKAAQRANVSTRDWFRWENKKVTPRATSLGHIADAFGISLDVFDDGHPNRSQSPLGDRLTAIERKLDLLLAASGLDGDAGFEELDAELDHQESEQAETDADGDQTPQAKRRQSAG